MSIWNYIDVYNNKMQHIQQLLCLQQKVVTIYNKLSLHLTTISTKQPSKLEILLDLFYQFDDVNSETDRTLLNIYIYINNIRMRHIGCHIQANYMDQISTLLSMINDQRKCLHSADYVNLLEQMNDTKDKSLEVYMPYLALQEIRTIKILLNGLVSITMMTNFVIKHLEQNGTCLDSIDSDLRNENPMYY